MTDQAELKSLIAKLRDLGGIVRTKHDATGAITEVSIGKVPGGVYRRVGSPGAEWMPPIAAAERMRPLVFPALGEPQ